MKKLLLILGLMLAYFTSDAQYRMHTVQEIAEARAGTRDIRFNTYLHKNLGVSQSLAGLQLDSLYLGFGIDQLGNGVLDSTWWTQAESFSRTNNLDSTIIRRGVVAIQVDTINGASTKLDTAFVMRTNYNRGLAIMHRDLFDVAPTEVIYMGNIQSPNLDSTTTLIYHNNISGNELFGITMTDSASIYTKSITLQEGNGIVIQAGDNESIVLRTYNDMLFRIDSTSLINPNEVNIAEGPGFRDTFFLVSYGSGNVETVVYKSIDTLRAYLGENGFGSSTSLPSERVTIFEDFFGGDSGTSPASMNYGWRWFDNGNADGDIDMSNSTFDENHPGIASVNGSLLAGTPYFELQNPNISPGKDLIFETVVKLTSLTLGDVIFIGLATTGDVDTDAIGFYWNGVGNIELRTRNDGVAQNTNTTVSESTSWMKLKFVLTHGGNLEFYIDDVLEGNISASDTSIPTSADPLVLTAIGTVIDASTTEFLVDYMSLEFNVTR